MATAGADQARAPAGHGSRAALALRLIAHIQPEDIALIGTMLLAPTLGGSSGLANRLLSGDHDPLLGAWALIAAVGAIAALASRVLGESDIDDQRRWLLLGPFMGALTLIGGSAFALLGIGDSAPFIVVAAAVVVGAFVFADRLPVVGRPLRRVLVTPFVLLSGALLQSFVVDIGGALGGSINVGDLLAQPDALVLVPEILLIVAMVSWIFYAMLVFAPRELASPGDTTRAWAVRFGLFFVTLLIGVVAGNAQAVLIT